MFGAPGPISQLFNLEQLWRVEKNWQIFHSCSKFPHSVCTPVRTPVSSGAEMKTLPVNFWHRPLVLVCCECPGYVLRKGQLNRHTRYRPATTTRNTVVLCVFIMNEMTFSMRFLACAVAGTAVVTAQRDVPYVFANVCHPPSSLNAVIVAVGVQRPDLSASL